MKCPNCQVNDNNGVYRKYAVGNLYVRERLCESCGKRFHTKEEIYFKDGGQQKEMDFGTPKVPSKTVKK